LKNKKLDSGWVGAGISGVHPRLRSRGHSSGDWNASELLRLAQRRFDVLHRQDRSERSTRRRTQQTEV